MNENAYMSMSSEFTCRFIVSALIWLRLATTDYVWLQKIMADQVL